MNEITSPVLTPLRDRYLGDFKTVSRVLLGVVGLVLLIACVNIAALMLVRGSSRAREIAIRTAMGASNVRIVTQLLTENLVLAAAGGACGVVLGAALLWGMVSRMPVKVPHWISFSLDGRFANLLCRHYRCGRFAVWFRTDPSGVAHRCPRSVARHSGLRSSVSRR